MFTKVPLFLSRLEDYDFLSISSNFIQDLAHYFVFGSPVFLPLIVVKHSPYHSAGLISIFGERPLRPFLVRLSTLL